MPDERCEYTPQREKPAYDIVISHNFSGLVNATNEAIARGYTPLGGPFQHTPGDPDAGPMLGQAMLLTEKPDQEDI